MQEGLAEVQKKHDLFVCFFVKIQIMNTLATIGGETTQDVLPPNLSDKNNKRHMSLFV